MLGVKVCTSHGQRSRHAAGRLTGNLRINCWNGLEKTSQDRLSETGKIDGKPD